MCKYYSSQEAPTNIADLFRNVCSDIRDVPHCHERVKARNLLSLLNVRLVCEAEVMGNGCQKHLHTDDEILRETGQFGMFDWVLVFHTDKKWNVQHKPKQVGAHMLFSHISNSWLDELYLTCNPVATASTLCHSHVCFSEIMPTFTSKAMTTACLEEFQK